MDNFGDLVGLVAGWVWLRDWWWYAADSSLAGRGSDRPDLQPGLWPSHGLAPTAEQARSG